MRSVRARFFNLPLSLLVLIAPTFAFAQSQRARVAVLDFGGSRIGSLVSDSIRSMFASTDATTPSNEFVVMDQDLAKSAARGTGYADELNMSRPQARDLGSAIGCDFYFIGEAQTLRRSSSTRRIYYETYASIFLVSARSGRLILWDRPAAEGNSDQEAETQFMLILSSARARYLAAAEKALQAERTERAAAIVNGVPVIEVLSEDKAGPNKDIQAPRPYRRIKPPYPEAAARAQVEATVDALVDIDANGEVGHVEIERWAGYGLDESVIATVKQMHFFPAMHDGIAVPLRVLLRYNFRKPPPDWLQNRSR